MHILGLRRLGYIAVHMGAGGDQLALASVPLCQNFGRRGTPKDARVDEPSEADVRDVS